MKENEEKLSESLKRERRLRYIIEHPKLWEGLPQTYSSCNDPVEVSQGCKVIVMWLKHEGLYQPNTEVFPTTIIKYVNKARRCLRGII